MASPRRAPNYWCPRRIPDAPCNSHAAQDLETPRRRRLLLCVSGQTPGVETGTFIRVSSNSSVVHPAAAPRPVAHSGIKANVHTDPPRWMFSALNLTDVPPAIPDSTDTYCLPLWV